MDPFLKSIFLQIEAIVQMDKLEGLSIERGVLPHTDGSAVCSIAGTTVIAAIYGPTETRGGRDELIDRAVIEVTYQPKIGSTMGCEGRVVEKFIGGLCESVILTKQYPQARFIISVQEINNRGCVLACAANAVCAALIDACVSMTSMFASVPCDVYKSGNISLHGAKAKDKSDVIVSTHTFVLDSRYATILSNSSKGKSHLTDADFDGASNLCKKACEDVFSAYKNLYKIEDSSTS